MARQAYAWMYSLHKKVVEFLVAGAVYQDMSRNCPIQSSQQKDNLQVLSQVMPSCSTQLSQPPPQHKAARIHRKSILAAMWNMLGAPSCSRRLFHPSAIKESSATSRTLKNSELGIEWQTSRSIGYITCIPCIVIATHKPV